MKRSSDEEIVTRERVMSAIKPSVAEKFAEHIPYHRPLAELESAAMALGSSPRDDGIVEMIVCRPATRSDKSSPKAS